MCLFVFFFVGAGGQNWNDVSGVSFVFGCYDSRSSGLPTNGSSGKWMALEMLLMVQKFQITNWDVKKNVVDNGILTTIPSTG